MLGDSESNWQQRIKPPAAGLLLHHAKIGKGDTNKFGICSQRRNEHFFIIVLLFSNGRAH
jgi:hypothetical protein